MTSKFVTGCLIVTLVLIGAAVVIGRPGLLEIASFAHSTAADRDGHGAETRRNHVAGQRGPTTMPALPGPPDGRTDSSTAPPPRARSASTAADGAGAISSPESARTRTGSVSAGTYVSVLAYGAVGDGATDDSAALQAAFDAARAGDTVVLPAGRSFAHAAVLTIVFPDVTVKGGGVLLATNESRSSLVLAADRVVLEDLTLRITQTTRRWGALEQQRLRIDGHTGVVVRNVRVEGSAAAGVFVSRGASNFLLDAVKVTGTRGDGIHMTGGSHDGQVVRPVVEGVGDDGVAVVSYRKDGTPCSRIIITSPVVDGSAGGRGVSVVGGVDVAFRDIDVRNTRAAGVYVAAEGSWDTLGVRGVQVIGGSVNGANTGQTIDHGSVLVFNGTMSQSVADVQISGLRLSGTRSTASRWVGVLSGGTPRVSGIVLEGLALDGVGPATPFAGDAPISSYHLAGWTRDGRLIAP